jgi:hypothetical protein
MTFEGAGMFPWLGISGQVRNGDVVGGSGKKTRLWKKIQSLVQNWRKEV